MSTMQKRSYVNAKYHLKLNNWKQYQKPVHSGEGETMLKLYNEMEKNAIFKEIKLKGGVKIKWEEKIETP